MTNILYEQLAQQFFKTEERENTLDIYGADERIYLNVFHKNFARPLSEELVVKVSDEVFAGIPHCFEQQGTTQPAIHFEALPPRLDNYSGHMIEVAVPNPFIQMSIWTGNRGKAELHDDQRRRYLAFSVGLYTLMLERKVTQQI